ncbi:hypothetical protein [Jeotgalibacillus sp. R-1-5s-1]|uniref:hypothetical protein n=1 Tax=Jeotgalibacillus sp. R-1-5s-1 TaxID=2555897 RepID=UPI00106A3401|nr:hypothetical protein [Jeotgalibacillus sp. R-1-5s-1]TFE00143.1 hypothetical protein E2491_06805 [Jeotgalibacillus sp. R-1-5s-1]
MYNHTPEEMTQWQDEIVKKKAFSSPAGNGTTEQIRLQEEYLALANAFLLAKHQPEKGRIRLLKTFLKEKRNQQVEIRLLTERAIRGKVSDVGRDFFILTSLLERIWIPYTAVKEATLPFDSPDFDTTHQQIFFDNDLRKKLLRDFGATVSKRLKLRELFYEETLMTSLDRWKGHWLKAEMAGGTIFSGRLEEATEEYVVLKGLGERKTVLYKELQTLRKARFYQNHKRKK